MAFPLSFRNRDGTSVRLPPKVVSPDGIRGDVWAYEVGSGKSTEDVSAYEHGAVMPVELARDLIKSYSSAGDVVLDVCAGTGTTGVAAIQTGRQYILFEPWTLAYEIAQRRLRNAFDSL